MLREIRDKVYDTIDVALQDQYTDLVDLYLVDMDNGVTLTLTSGVSPGDTTCTVADATGVLTDGTQAFCMSEDDHVYQGLVQSVVDNVITFTPPIDSAFTTSALVHASPWNLALANGAVTPKIFSVGPPPNASWDITTFIWAMGADAVMYGTVFGPIAPLTNGLLMRKVDGEMHNYFLVYNNDGLAERATRVEYPEKVPSGTYTFRAIRELSGQGNSGVTIRLDGATNDRIQVVVQDNLIDVDFLKFAVLVRGHIVLD